MNLVASTADRGPCKLLRCVPEVDRVLPFRLGHGLDAGAVLDRLGLLPGVDAPVEGGVEGLPDGVLGRVDVRRLERRRRAREPRCAVVEGGTDRGAVVVAGVAHDVAGEPSDDQHRDHRRDQHPPLMREPALGADQQLLEIDAGGDGSHPPFDALPDVPPELVVVHRSITRRS
jgi:hypothetical protein